MQRPPASLDPRLVALMARVGLKEEDCLESFARAGGPGGQKVNKTASAVRLTHLPSGIGVRADEHRSQRANRLAARRRLAEKLWAQQAAGRAEAALARHKIRQQKARRRRRAQAKVLADKQHQADKKARRRPQGGDEG